MIKKCAVILAGGQGKRMKSELPKPMFEVLGEPMLEWVIRSCEESGISDICVVKGYNAQVIEDYLGGRYDTVLQEERKGTGHAVMTAIDWLRSKNAENVIILNGDAPFVDAETIIAAFKQHEENQNSVTIITSEIPEPFGYGRILRSGDGSRICGIVEEKDATIEQKKLHEINSGAYWFRTDDLITALGELKPNNSQNEYYLTDTVFILLDMGKRAEAYKSGNPDVVLGANDRRGLLMLNDTARKNIIGKLLDSGVEFLCTDGVSVGGSVKIGAGTKILQGTIIKGSTLIGENCVIGPNCLIENCEIGRDTNLNYVQAYDSVIDDGVKIGPFVQIRPGSHIKSRVKIGDFVEIKNSTIGEHTSVSHLTYIGDSDVGRNVNFGCGVATANYDGENKFRTKVGDNAFIGCHTNLIAPVTVGDSAYTAAGSTVTKDVPDGALVIERAELSFHDGYGENKLRSRREKFKK